MAKPTFDEDINGINYRYWNCPIKFIPDNVWQFFKIYDAHKSLNLPMPEYKNLSKRYLLAAQYYVSKHNEFVSQVMEKR